jgi:Carboxypeptidase regulatory-like domain
MKGNYRTMKNKLTETQFKAALHSARHLFRSRVSGCVLLKLVLASGTALAGTAAIEGTVKDPNGKMISGAEVRIEASGGSSGTRNVKTDAKGHYAYKGLEAGTYRVSLLVNGSVKASINNAKIKLGEPTQLNFELKSTSIAQASGSAKKAKHMVWMPAQTGSHIGGGWVEVDDSGTADLDKVSGKALLPQVSQATSATWRRKNLPSEP